MKFVILLIIAGVALSQNFDSCFNELRCLVKNPVDVKKIPAQEIQKYLDVYNKRIDEELALKKTCETFFEFLIQFKDDLIKHDLFLAYQRLNHVASYRKDCLEQLAGGLKDEEKANVLKYFLESTISDLSTITSGITGAIYYAYWDMTTSKDCTNKIFAAYNKAYKPNMNVPAVLDETIASFNACKGQKFKPFAKIRRMPKLINSVFGTKKL
eukprot:TRINITY_DN882_c0_g1_i7.p2 TRINITY_DN882_c0_g1~~TRINITY_DN882_c0_g1_i7.p2  ORF type:complete len:212 (+),score=57.46 TRINITY_DN882_c0_g1_i7:67-702(+)